MRYLLNNDFESELSSRASYLYDVFHLYFSSRNSEGFIHLIPMGKTELPILFIVGHNVSVYRFLLNHRNDIDEKIIVLISCIDDHFIRCLPTNVNVYATNSLDEKNTNLYNGYDFGFAFDISESELKFYNSNETDYYKRITEAFFEIQTQ